MWVSNCTNRQKQEGESGQSIEQLRVAEGESSRARFHSNRGHATFVLLGKNCQHTSAYGSSPQSSGSPVAPSISCSTSPLGIPGCITLPLPSSLVSHISSRVHILQILILGETLNPRVLAFPWGRKDAPSASQTHHPLTAILDLLRMPCDSQNPSGVASQPHLCPLSS